MAHDIDELLVMNRTGHQSTSTVKLYKRPSSDLQKEVSDILQPPVPKAQCVSVVPPKIDVVCPHILQPAVAKPKCVSPSTAKIDVVCPPTYLSLGSAVPGPSSWVPVKSTTSVDSRVSVASQLLESSSVAPNLVMKPFSSPRKSVVVTSMGGDDLIHIDIKRGDKQVKINL